MNAVASPWMTSEECAVYLRWLTADGTPDLDRLYHARTRLGLPATHMGGSRSLRFHRTDVDAWEKAAHRHRADVNRHPRNQEGRTMTTAGETVNDIGVTAVHERPEPLRMAKSELRDEDTATLRSVPLRQIFKADVRQHLRVLGPSALLAAMAHAHLWQGSAAVTNTSSPTVQMFVAFAKTDADGWAAVLRIVGDVLSEAREAQAASRG